jgi:hypothetical protein
MTAAARAVAAAEHRRSGLSSQGRAVWNRQALAKRLSLDVCIMPGIFSCESMESKESLRWHESLELAWQAQ